MAIVLIIDDRSTGTEELRNALKREGHCLLESALDLAHKAPPDLIIADLDSCELAREMTREELFAATPVIFYTATHIVEEARALADASGVGYLGLASADPDAVVRAVSEALGTAKQPTTAHGQRKESRETCCEAENRYWQMTENIRDVLFLSDRLAGKVHYVNSAYEQVWQRSREELLSNPGSWAESIHPDDRHRVVLTLTGWKSTEPLIQEYRIIRPDGSQRWIRDRAFPVQDKSGELCQIAGVAEDITERKRAEETIRESVERLRSVFEGAAIGMALVDCEGTWLQVNPALCRILGYSASELAETTLQALTHPDDLDAEVSLIRRTVSGELDSYEVDVRFRHVSGRWVHTLVSGAVTSHADGEMPRLIIQVQDVTHRKELEEQLLQAQKMEAVGRLAGGVAHDFNNLLTAIIGYSQLAMARLAPDDRLQLELDEIYKAAMRAAGLTGQLLAFSRRQAAEPKVLELDVITSGIAKMLKRVIGEDIEVVTLAEQKVGRIKADPIQIEQVIMNLAVNARDAMPDGGKLTIETRNVTLDEQYTRWHMNVRPGQYVMLAVSDTGCGMDAETRSRVFEPFFTTKEQGKGTGLGLSTAYGIVKQNGGDIWIYSEPGKGTTFKLYFPRVDECEERVATAEESRSMPRGSETILVVEDETLVRTLAGDVLRGLGYTVLEAPDGDEALRVVRQNGCDIHLLLTDVVMPRMSGRELADHVKALLPGINVVFASGYTDDTILQYGIMEAGAHFIQKPFSPAGLAHKVREVLDRNRDPSITLDHAGPTHLRSAGP
jgi:PAS domain S-box-containing protein